MAADDSTHVGAPFVSWREYVDGRFDVVSASQARQSEHIGELYDRTDQIPVLTERVGNMIDAFKAIRGALYAAAGGFVLLFLSVLYQIVRG